MLQHEQSGTEESTDAAQVRVTAQELALAAAAIETRRATEASRQANTLTLSEAVRQFGLSTTPEEMLAEVDAVRAERAAAEKKELTARSGRRMMATCLGTIVALAAIITSGAVVLVLCHRLYAATHPWPALPIQPLSHIADNQPFHMDVQTLQNLAKGTLSPEETYVDTRQETRPSAFNKEWTVTRSGGRYYALAWATADEALKAANDQGASVFSDRPPWLPASNVVTVKLPVIRFRDAYVAEDENLQPTDYSRDGKEVDKATGIVQGVTVDSTCELLERGLTDADAHSYGRSAYTVSVDQGIVHLTGQVQNAAAKQRATRLANDLLQRMDRKYRLSNELDVVE